jgi:hypothetical protein
VAKMLGAVKAATKFYYHRRQDCLPKSLGSPLVRRASRMLRRTGSRRPRGTPLGSRLTVNAVALGSWPNHFAYFKVWIAAPRQDVKPARSRYSVPRPVRLQERWTWIRRRSAVAITSAIKP